MLEGRDDRRERQVIVDQQQSGERAHQAQLTAAHRQRQVHDEPDDHNVAGKGRRDARKAPLQEQADRLAFEDQDVGHQPAAEDEEEFDADDPEGGKGLDEMAENHQQDTQPAPAVEQCNVPAPNRYAHRGDCRIADATPADFSYGLG